jgi:hypothetical protein
MGIVEPSNATKPKINVDDAKHPLVKKHSKPPIGA